VGSRGGHVGSGPVLRRARAGRRVLLALGAPALRAAAARHVASFVRSVSPAGRRDEHHDELRALHARHEAAVPGMKLVMGGFHEQPRDIPAALRALEASLGAALARAPRAAGAAVLLEVRCR
jgi:hypothetical protein